MSKKEALIKRLAEIQEKPGLTENDGLENWDSLCVVSAIVAIDEECGMEVDHATLADCSTVRDVLILAGIA